MWELLAMCGSSGSGEALGEVFLILGLILIGLLVIAVLSAAALLAMGGALFVAAFRSGAKAVQEARHGGSRLNVLLATSLSVLLGLVGVPFIWLFFRASLFRLFLS